MPWWKFEEDPEADGDLPEAAGHRLTEASAQGGHREKVINVRTKEAKPREMYITEKNMREHGYTTGCGGCTSVLMGTGRQPHSDRCRHRFGELLKGEAKAKNAERRKREVIEEAGVKPEEFVVTDKKARLAAAPSTSSPPSSVGLRECTPLETADAPSLEMEEKKSDRGVKRPGDDIDGM